MPESSSLVPPWYFFVHTVLEVMSDGEVRTSRAIDTAAVAKANLPEEALAEALASGSSRAQDRTRWATTHCFKAGFLDRVARGQYRITPKGRIWLAENPHRLENLKQANQVFREYWPKSNPDPLPAADATADLTSEFTLVSPAVNVETSHDSESSPIEQIEAAIATLRQETATELLQRLRDSDPTFFEEAVVKVLLAMGYGGAEQRGQRIGGTGDGGVDGVIDQDALGLDQIYVQAKRYADGNTVGRETIQAFVGALQGRGASRGVFITSSAFTKNALDFAQRIQTRIILIDGTRLADLMIKYRVGVQIKQTYDVVEIDEDFFE